MLGHWADGVRAEIDGQATSTTLSGNALNLTLPAGTHTLYIGGENPQASEPATASTGRFGGGVPPAVLMILFFAAVLRRARRFEEICAGNRK